MRRNVASVQQKVVQVPADVLEFEESVVNVGRIVGNSFFVINKDEIGIG